MSIACTCSGVALLPFVANLLCDIDNIIQAGSLALYLENKIRNSTKNFINITVGEPILFIAAEKKNMLKCCNNFVFMQQAPTI